MLKGVNLSPASLCGADCIFCPPDRGKRIKQKIMPFGTAERIVAELSSQEFKKRHAVEKIELGENGDAFLNPEFIRILRLIKQKLPEVRTSLYTNFQNFTPEKAQTILAEGLVGEFHCNIDGGTPENYFKAKRIPYENTMHNLEAFLALRRELKSKASLRVHVITLGNYVRTIRNNFGFYPAKMGGRTAADIPDDFNEIKRQISALLLANRFGISKGIVEKAGALAVPLNRLLNSGNIILRAGVYGWAERGSAAAQKIDCDKYSCPLIDKVRYEAFIAPDGTWYACCLDSNNELAFGNVLEQGLDSVYSGKERKKLIAMLDAKEFAKIGGPCKTVNCCQRLWD